MVGIIDWYSPNAWKTAGESGARLDQVQEPFKGGLLHLVYHLIYTVDGRAWLHQRVVGADYTEQQVRAELVTLMNNYRISAKAQEAVIGAHLAGSAWVKVYNDPNGSASQRDEQEAIFKQHTAAISWFLWEEGSGPLFPLPW